MTSQECKRIRLGDQQVGIIGLDEAFEELAQSHGSLSDEEIGLALVQRLKKRNYIPKSAEAEYSEALLREFRRFLGDAPEEDSEGALDIKVLGPGCSQCDRLEQAVMQALSEMNLPASVEHVTDIKEIASYGFVATPALMINGKVVVMGRVPSQGKLKLLIEKGI